MWPFNRNQRNTDQQNIPPEVEQYYQSERRDRVGVAWLLAGATLVATVLVALVLFFGGRWVYHKIKHTNNANQTATTQQATSNKPSEQAPATTPQPSSSSNNSSNNSTPSSGSSAAPSGSSSGQSSPSASSSQGMVTAPTQANNPSSVSSQPTQTTAGSSNLTNTGPGDTIALFFAVSGLGFIGHQIYTRRKFNQN